MTTSRCDDIAYDTREIDNRRSDDRAAGCGVHNSGICEDVSTPGPLEVAAAIFIDAMEHAQNTRVAWS